MPLPYHEARKYPPKNSADFREATAAESIAVEWGLDAERLYRVYAEHGHSLSKRLWDYMNNKTLAHGILKTAFDSKQT